MEYSKNEEFRYNSNTQLIRYSLRSFVYKKSPVRVGAFLSILYFADKKTADMVYICTNMDCFNIH